MFAKPDLELRRGIRLEWFTIGYNSLEGMASIAAGALAGSIALVGFGFDSAIEVISGAALLWRLHAHTPQVHERRERIALKAVGYCFLALAIYVAWDAIHALVSRVAPQPSRFGVVVAALSLLIMPVLARAKRRVAAGIGSSAMTADARQTDFCTYLSAILLAGLVLNATLGWWWADPVAALVMIPIIAREGLDGLRGKTCCASCH
jgi:divalent metal cation (Fe/Co/Zn/Cd) transporter